MRRDEQKTEVVCSKWQEVSITVQYENCYLRRGIDKCIQPSQKIKWSATRARKKMTQCRTCLSLRSGREDRTLPARAGITNSKSISSSGCGGSSGGNCSSSSGSIPEAPCSSCQRPQC